MSSGFVVRLHRRMVSFQQRRPGSRGGGHYPADSNPLRTIRQVVMMVTDKQKLHSIASAVSLLMFFGASAIANALTCAPAHFTLSEAYESADRIIVGLITECKEEVSRDAWVSGGSECSFTSLEILKESVPARDYNGVTSSAACGLSLQVGSQYLLFLNSRNQPMQFSAPLDGDQPMARRANDYLRMLRDFRNGAVGDLAEPWLFGKISGYCTAWHRVGGNTISFRRAAPGTPQQPMPDWTQETTGGKKVYRAIVPTYDVDSQSPSEEAEMVVFGEIPEYSNDALTLTVNLLETPPAPVREATLSAGDRTWSLIRMETDLSVLGRPVHKMVEYFAIGDVAEQVLSAMTRPSAIVVAATVVESTMDSALPGAPPPDEDFVEMAPSMDNGFGQVAPGLTRRTATLNDRAARTYRTRKEPPATVLRVETRSTQLPNVIQSFRACYSGDEQ